MEKLRLLEERLGVVFNNQQFLIDALTYFPSNFVRENNTPHENERLEHLGDAVLEIVIVDFLFRTYPMWNESKMTEVRSLLASETMARAAAELLKLDECLTLSAEVEDYTYRPDISSTMMSDAFESVLAAVYLDQGLEPVKKLVERCIFLYFNFEDAETNEVMHPKNEYQLKVYKKYKATPFYRVIKKPTRGLPGNRFVCGVYIRGDLIAQGIGFNLKEAETQAAIRGLELFIE